jgi:hypothetical protein
MPNSVGTVICDFKNSKVTDADLRNEVMCYFAFLAREMYSERQVIGLLP